jgi:SAM-dependent methyltransferase
VASKADCVLCDGALETVLDDVTDTRFGVPGRFSIARCVACGLEQTLPRPSQAALIALYRDHYNFTGTTGRSYLRLRSWLHAPGLYRLWLALDGDISFHRRPGRGRLLDVGCNEGRGLAFYRANGFAAEGLEANPVAAAAAREAGFVVHGEDLAAFRPATPYDVVVLSNVLEHFLAPRAALDEIRRLLRPGGEVWISCPNAASWLRSLAGRAWINWHVPFHIVHFRAPRLQALLEEAGFALVEARQITPALWVAQSLIARAFARPGRTTRALRNPLLVAGLMAVARLLLFPLLWLGNRRGRGDCLIAVAARR